MLGQNIRPFDQAAWNAVIEEVALAAVRQKFESDPALGEYLLATGDKRIAEASPRDRIWGIGLAASNPLARTGQSGADAMFSAVPWSESELHCA